MDRKRDPKGIPTGGRFAEDRKAEVDIDLAGGFTPEPSEEDLELARDQLGLSASEDDVHSLAASWAADFAAEQDEPVLPEGSMTNRDLAEELASEHGTTVEAVEDWMGHFDDRDTVHDAETAENLRGAYAEAVREEADRKDDGDVASVIDELAAKYGRTPEEVGDWVDNLTQGDDGYDAQSLDDIRLAYAASVADEDSTPTIASTLEDQGEIAMDSSEHGDDVFEMVQVHSVGEIEEGMVTVTGNVSLNVEDGLAPYMPDFSDEDDPEVLVNAWLEDRAPLISTWMEERYGAQDENADDWDHQTYEFAVNVPDTTPIDRLTTVLREKTKALTFYNESDHGSFGHENMFDALSTHLAEKDREAESVAAGYIERLINTSDEISGKENGITPSSVAVAVDDARMFMHRNRDTVARVLANVDGARPLGYAITEAHIGDWLAGARAGEATPLDMLGEDGARLRESAESERARTVSIDDDGNIRLPLS